MSDALADGRRVRALCGTRAFSRECLATVVDAPISGIRVTRELGRIAEMPCMVVRDTGTALASNAMLNWQEDQPGRMARHRAGQRMQNGVVKSFDGRLRDASLNEPLFLSPRHARHLIAAWRDDHTHHRPHPSLDGLTRRAYHKRSEEGQALNRANL